MLSGQVVPQKTGWPIPFREVTHRQKDDQCRKAEPWRRPREVLTQWRLGRFLRLTFHIPDAMPAAMVAILTMTFSITVTALTFIGQDYGSRVCEGRRNATPPA